MRSEWQICILWCKISNQQYSFKWSSRFSFWSNLCLKEATTLFIKSSKKLLKKLCKGCTFLADDRLIKQIDGCPMGGPISVVVPNIFCIKMELDVVKLLRPELYKRFVHDNRW